MPDSVTPDMPDPGTVVQQSPPRHLIGDTSVSATVADGGITVAGNERYELLEEIARGGMGVVWRARDRALDRDVGLKTLLKVPAEGSVIAARFREEARITGQLQHPNIPPVHDLGTLPDGRPFLAMKLIKGRTLDAMLKDRPDSSHEPGRYLAIFEQIAQGVAYAHAHKVIHRDLKPLNVMVGAFGEVQVMDWGLAKVLTELPDQTQIVPVLDADAATVIRDSRDDTDRTSAGSIFGTPAYMPPEQAIGAVDQIDTRADVFSLGAVLCVVLTGKPPYIGRDGETTRQLAARANLTDAFTRLEASGAEPDLLALCKKCLAAEQSERYRDASEVAKAVAALRAEAEQRARDAELDRVRAEGDRAKAEVQAAEQRKRRKVQLALLAAVLLIMTGGGAVAWWQDKQAGEQRLKDERAASEQQLKDERAVADRKASEAKLAGERDAEARNKAQQARAGVNASLTLAADLRKQYKFKQAEAALAQAVELAKSGAPERLAEVEQAQRDLAFVVQLDDIRYRKWLWLAEAGGEGTFNTKIASPEYRKAFAAHGLDLTTLSPAESAKRIATSTAKADLVAAVDDWALYEPDATLRDRLLEITRKADPGPWTDRLRDPRVWKDKAAVAKLAAEVELATTFSASLSFLATLMERTGLDPSPLLTAARTKYPTNFELAFALGQWHVGSNGEQIGSYEAARSLRPENWPVWHNLGVAFHGKGDFDGAIAAYKKVIELDPRLAQTHSNMGVALDRKGDKAGAIASHRKAIELDPKSSQAYYNLGVMYQRKGDVDGAIVAYRKAIEFDPKHAAGYNNLGITLMSRGDVGDAITAHKKAIELDSKHVLAHNNLGLALADAGDTAGAIAAHRKAIELDSKYAQAYYNLGIVLYGKGDSDGAIVAYRKTIELDPKHAEAYSNLGIALERKRDIEGAVAAYKKAIELDPKLALAHSNLGLIYFKQKKHADAAAAARTAIRIDPAFSNAHVLLGLTLQQTGDISGARAALTEAARLDKRWEKYLVLLPPPLPVAPPPRAVTRP